MPRWRARDMAGKVKGASEEPLCRCDVETTLQHELQVVRSESRATSCESTTGGRLWRPIPAADSDANCPPAVLLVARNWRLATRDSPLQLQVPAPHAP